MNRKQTRRKEKERKKIEAVFFMTDCLKALGSVESWVPVLALTPTHVISSS